MSSEYLNEILRVKAVTDHLAYIKNRYEFLKEASVDPENDKKIQQSCEVEALFEECRMKNLQLELLIYKTISTGKPLTVYDVMLISKYKKKHTEYSQKSLEHLETMNEIEAIQEGEYIRQANHLKFVTDRIDSAINCIRLIPSE